MNIEDLKCCGNCQSLVGCDIKRDNAINVDQACAFWVWDRYSVGDRLVNVS